MEAWAELDKIIGDSDEIAAPQALETFLAQYHALAGNRHTVEERSPIGVPEIADTARSPIVALDIADVISSASSAVEISTSTRRPAAEDPLDTEVQSLTDLFSASFPSSVVESSKPRPWVRTMGLAVALIALASGGVVAGRRYLAPNPARAVSGTLAINTNPAGALVTVDGEPRGVTPVNLALDAGAHIVELSGAGEPRSIPVTIVAGAQASQYVELRARERVVGSAGGPNRSGRRARHARRRVPRHGAADDRRSGTWGARRDARGRRWIREACGED